MGVTPSKIDDDKVLALCQERKRFVREALDGRCALAASHCAYILSLRQTGHLLRKCFEAEVLKESIPNGNRENSAVTPVNVLSRSSIDVLPACGESKEPYPDLSDVVKDLDSCMKKVEILFVRANNSGKEVLRILEEDKIQFSPLLPEEIAHGSKPSSFLQTLFACCWEDVSIPESPSQAEIKYLTWHRSVCSQLSTSGNPLGTNDGIHISMLDRLYAWESKLYDEIKASSAIRRQYDEKCKKLRQQESRGNNRIAIDFTRATVKDLHSRVLVSLQKIDFISKNIEDIRDKHIQPRLDELIGSVTRMWATMLECHRRQCAIIKLVSRSYNLKISSQSECRSHVVILLTIELRKLCSNFQNWMASLKAYLYSLHLWLHKCMKPLKRRKGYRKKNVVEVVPTGCVVAPIFTACELWIKLLDDFSARDMEEAIEGLLADISHSVPHQDETPKDDGMGVGILTRYAPANLQASLLRFLEKLEAFSEVSLQKYIDLQKDISAAKETVWRKD